VFRHVVMFKFRDDATEEQRRAVSAGLAGLPSSIPGVRAFAFGPDAGVAADNYDLAVVAEFDDEAAYREYAGHEEHQRVVRQLIRPVIVARAAVQFAS
jgi:hypothetical protein